MLFGSVRAPSPERSGLEEVKGIERALDVPSASVRPVFDGCFASTGDWQGDEVRISQYVYFAVRSPKLTPQELTADLLVEPDVAEAIGSRDLGRGLPRFHSWVVECRVPGLRVDELIDQVVSRVAPATDRVRALVDSGQAEATLHIVRNLDDEQGDPEHHDPVVGADGGEATVLLGQHQLLGWHLDRRVVEFLHASGAEVDADEYG